MLVCCVLLYCTVLLCHRAGEVVAVIKRYSAVRFDKADDESETSSVVGKLPLSSCVMCAVLCSYNSIFSFLVIFVF